MIPVNREFSSTRIRFDWLYFILFNIEIEIFFQENENGLNCFNIEKILIRRIKVSTIFFFFWELLLYWKVLNQF